MRNSDLINMPVKSSGLRAKYGVNILAIQRDNHYIFHNLKDVKLQYGDTLLIQGTWTDIARLSEKTFEWVVVGQPLAEASKVTLTHKAPLAAGIMLLMIAAILSEASLILSMASVLFFICSLLSIICPFISATIPLAFSAFWAFTCIFSEISVMVAVSSSTALAWSVAPSANCSAAPARSSAPLCTHWALLSISPMAALSDATISLKERLISEKSPL